MQTFNPIALVWILSLLLLPITARAASHELVSVEASTTGETEEAAIINALIEAIRQVSGTKVESEKVLRTTMRQTDDKTSISLFQNQQIRTKTKGLVDSYKVLSLGKEGTSWRAKLLVTVPQYQSVGPDRSHLRAIAVLPFRVSSNVPPGISGRLEQGLVTHFAQSRRFRVLDREFGVEVGGEKSRLRSDETLLSELVKTGQEIGTDYLLAGEITEFSVKSTANGAFEQASGRVEYRVIELAPREVRWANTVSLSYSRDTLQRQGLQGNKDQIQLYLLNQLADLAATEVLDAIYPIKVLKAERDGAVLLNQGGNRVQVGRWLSILKGIENVLDPDTGLYTRVEGGELAVVSVSKVFEKYCEVKLLEGSLEVVQPGMPCRRLSPDRLDEMNRKAQEQFAVRQRVLISEGKCPPLIVLPARTILGWNLLLKNPGSTPLRIHSIAKRVGSTQDKNSFALIIAPGSEESIGLPYAFASGDSLEFESDKYEAPFTFIFP